MVLERFTYRTRAGVSAQFGRLFPSRRALGIDAGIVLRVNPLHLTGRLLEWVKAALRALNSHLLVLRDGIQGLDDRVRSLAASCGHLCDTYLSKRNGKEKEEKKEKRTLKWALKRKIHLRLPVFSQKLTVPSSSRSCLFFISLSACLSSLPVELRCYLSARTRAFLSLSLFSLIKTAPASTGSAAHAIPVLHIHTAPPYIWHIYTSTLLCRHASDCVLQAHWARTQLFTLPHLFSNTKQTYQLLLHHGLCALDTKGAGGMTCFATAAFRLNI